MAIIIVAMRGYNCFGLVGGAEGVVHLCVVGGSPMSANLVAVARRAKREGVGRLVSAPSRPPDPSPGTLTIFDGGGRVVRK